MIFEFIIEAFKVFFPVIFMISTSILIWHILTPRKNRWLDIGDPDEGAPILVIMLISAVFTILVIIFTVVDKDGNEINPGPQVVEAK